VLSECGFPEVEVDVHEGDGYYTEIELRESLNLSLKKGLPKKYIK